MCYLLKLWFPTITAEKPQSHVTPRAGPRPTPTDGPHPGRLFPALGRPARGPACACPLHLATCLTSPYTKASTLRISEVASPWRNTGPMAEWFCFVEFIYNFTFSVSHPSYFLMSCQTESHPAKRKLMQLKKRGGGKQFKKKLEAICDFLLASCFGWLYLVSVDWICFLSAQKVGFNLLSYSPWLFGDLVTTGGIRPWFNRR